MTKCDPDNYRKCYFCGARQDLEEHHYIPVRLGIENYPSLEETVTLCHDCHNKQHRLIDPLITALGGTSLVLKKDIECPNCGAEPIYLHVDVYEEGDFLWDEDGDGAYIYFECENNCTADGISYVLDKQNVDELDGLDIDVIESGHSKSQRERIKSIRESIQKVSKESEGGKASVEEVIELAEENGIEREKAEKEIDSLKRSGEIIEHEMGYLRLV